MVLTPGGYRHLGKVSLLCKDALVASADAVQAGEPRKTPAPAARPAQGWVAYTAWMNENTDAIRLFTAKWTVPPEPDDKKSGQTLFLFIGLQNTQFILQPVLQWGPSHAGGGNFWSIANWYTDGTTGQTVCSEATPVKPGQSLTAKIECTGNVGRSFTYRASFEGFPDLDIERNNVVELLWAFVVLEAYGIKGPNNYPASPKVRLQPSISMETSHAAPAWATLPQPHIAASPRAVLVSDGIDLFFR